MPGCIGAPDYPPGDCNDSFLDLMSGLETSGSASWHVPFSGPPLPTAGNDSSQSRAFAEQFKLEIGADVDFWTEASLFARAGIPAIVLGPGNIAQAHVLNEWVSLEQLQLALDIYTKIVTTTVDSHD